MGKGKLLKKRLKNQNSQRGKLGDDVKTNSSTRIPEKFNLQSYSLLLFAIALVLYLPSIQYDFTLDDQILIYKNSLTTEGWTAIPAIFSTDYLNGSQFPDSPLYRPVSKAIFAICWSLSEGEPFLFHFVNILFYALTGALLFRTLIKYFDNSILLSLITSLIFLFHPVHSEVVCNIKSLDEILCFLFFLASLHRLHTYLETNKKKDLIGAALYFFLSFISKESAIAFLVVYPLIAFYRKSDRSQIVQIIIAMLVTTGLVLAIRTIILKGSSEAAPSEIDNILSVAPDFLTREMTAIYLLGKYILLMLFPHPLVCDYSSRQIELVVPGDVFSLLTLAGLLLLLSYAVIRSRQRDWTGFGILYFFISISVTSNIFFIGGSHFAERFLYAPSLGFSITVSTLLHRFLAKRNLNTANLKELFLSNISLNLIVASIVVIYSVKVIIHIPVWKNNVSLFENGIKNAPKSYRMHLALAQDLSDDNYLKSLDPDIREETCLRAASEAKIALSIYEKTDAYEMAGTIYYKIDRYDSALAYYTAGLRLAPENFSLNYYTGKTLDKLKRYKDAIPYLNKALIQQPDNDGVLFNLALSYTNLNDLNKGLEYFMQVIKFRPDRADAYSYIAQIYRAKGDNENAGVYMKKANEVRASPQ